MIGRDRIGATRITATMGGQGAVQPPAAGGQLCLRSYYSTPRLSANLILEPALAGSPRVHKC